MFGLIVGLRGACFGMEHNMNENPERAFSNFAAKASAEAVSLEKSYVFGFGFCALKPLLKEKPNRCF